MSERRTYLPLGIDVEGLKCLVVGGGRVGSRKAVRLVGHGAAVTVLSPQLSWELESLLSGGRLVWVRELYRPEYLDDQFLVVAATADEATNLRIGSDARARGILTCVASSAADSRLIFPAAFSQEGICVSVHSQGNDCRRSKQVRDEIASWMNRPEGAAPVGGARVERASASVPRGAAQKSAGLVYLVGAGPGAYDLISLRGLRALRAADVIICDELLPPGFLDELGLSLGGKTVVRRAKNGPLACQADVNRTMSEAALCGKVVARLKVGDPHIFGRGGEETEYLDGLGIPRVVVPGMSSCTVAPEMAELPLTRRLEQRSFAVASAVCAGGGVNADCPKAESLVLLMAVGSLEQVVKSLQEAGWSGETPAAVVERATLTWERRVDGTLATIVDAAQRGEVRPPAVLIVGKAASAGDSAKSRPRILFTGTDPANFHVLGNLMHWPALQVLRNEAGFTRFGEAAARLQAGDFGLVVFSSRVGVTMFFQELEERGLDTRILGRAVVAAAGYGTAARLREWGVRSDVVSGEAGGRVITEAARGAAPGRALVVQGAQAPQNMGGALGGAGLEVEHLLLHAMAPHPELGRKLPEHDVAYFVSPSGVAAYWDAYGEEAFRGEVWCVGSVTLEALEARGLGGKVVNPYAMAGTERRL